MSSTPEGEVLNAVGDYLSLKKYVFWRANNVPVFSKESNTFRKMPKYSRKGVSDYIVVHKGKTYFLELKSKVGRQSDDQKSFQQSVETEGAVYGIIRSIDDVIAIGL